MPTLQCRIGNRAGRAEQAKPRRSREPSGNRAAGDHSPGGASAEREVSLRSGDGVAQALESLGHEVVRIVLDRPETFAEAIVKARIDVAFLALHGRYGEDGCVQGLLELLRIPYTGSSVLASALAMDKLKAKELFLLHNVPTPPYFVADESTLEGLAETHESFGFPAVVKPRREGSSVGLAIAKDLPELAAVLFYFYEI